MSFLNGAELCLNFPADTPEHQAARAATEAAQAKRNQEVADINAWMAEWRRSRGYPIWANVEPEGWPFSDEARRAYIVKANGGAA